MPRRVGPKTRIRRAKRRAEAELTAQTDQGSKYARGLAREGYIGGYLDALSDALLALNGVKPERRRWWEDEDA